MRRLAIVSLSVIALVSGAAPAQSEMTTAVSIGFPLLVNVHLGLEDLIAPGADLRLNFGGAMLAAGGAWGFFGVAGADVLFRVVDLDAPPSLVPYAGGGVGLALLGGGGAGGADLGAGFTGAGVLGAEYRTEGLGFFLEGRVNVTFTGGGPLVWPNIGLGVVFRN